MLLTDVKTGRSFAVRALPEDPEARQEAQMVGIIAGKPMRLIRRAPFWGPLLLDVEGNTVAVRWRLASRLEVQTIDVDRPAPND